MQLTSLEIESNDLEATAHFYNKILGLPITVNTEEQVSFQLPEGVLSFLVATTTHPQYHIALNIPQNQVHQAVTWLASRAEVIPINEKQLVADFKNWNAEAVYFFDNNRNIVEFIGRRDLDNGSSKPFGPHSILGLSEVGIVTDDVPTTSAMLIEKYQLCYFTKQPALEHFAAVGDDEGLFIVVSNNRNCYPTTNPSTLHPLHLQFWANGQLHNLDWPIK